MDRKDRWRLAQENELRWWKHNLTGNDFSYFAAFASELVNDCAAFVSLSPRTRILEIGSGPAGIVTHVTAGFRCGIDPLEPFFSRQERCRAVRNPAVRYAAAQAERLPFAADSFNFLIIDNILDHCEDIDPVFAELTRVCSAGGLIYLRNFTSTRWGVFLAELLEFFRIDRGHPYHFRKQELLGLFNRHGLELLLMKGGGFFRHQQKLLSQKKISHFLRALSLSQADKVMFLLRNHKPTGSGRV